MKKCKILILLFCFTTLIFTGCKNEPQYIGIKRESISYDEKIFPVEQPPVIEIVGDTSNIEIYNWDEKNVKFEMLKKLKRVYNKEEQLDAEYKKYKISAEQEKNEILFKYKYEDDKSNALDQSLDLKVYIPKKVKFIKIKLDLGRGIIHDDINCDITTELNMANMEIKRFKGVLDFKGDMSNIKISNGILYSGSKVSVNMGNIHLKFESQEGGEYEFKTKIGNIDLAMPESSKINLDSTGYVQTNELKNGEYPTKIIVETEMGRICLNKY